jgi:hypothetical protein
MMGEIDFAPTTSGGRVRLSSIEQVLRPSIEGGERWVTPVVTVGGTMVNIGPFTSETAALHWVDAAFPAWRLP